MNTKMNTSLSFFQHILIIAIMCVTLTDTKGACPCENPKWCEPVTTIHEKEVFQFSLTNTGEVWGKYDWTRLTTLGVFKVDTQLVCLAHQHNVRVVLVVDYPGSELLNATQRSVWVGQQLRAVQGMFLDGVNIDFEEPIPSKDKARADALTDLVNETVTAFKHVSPHYQISFDVAYGPDCEHIGERCFDYQGLASVLDFLFVMAYDECCGDGEAGANSGYHRTLNGLKQYLEIIPSRKLVLGVPWYGYLYTCALPDKQSGKCSLAGRLKQVKFSDIYNTLTETHAKRRWDSVELSPFFNYYEPSNQTTYQIWYDDPESLTYKYQAAEEYQMRGVGVWHAQCVDYGDSALANAVRQWMWDALPLVNPYPH